MNRGQFSISIADSGTTTIVYFNHHLNGGAGGVARRTFPNQDTLDAWWLLNARAPSAFVRDDWANQPALNLAEEVPFDAELAASLPERSVNALGLLRRAEEEHWLATNAKVPLGARRRYEDGGAHVGNGAEVTVVAIRMDHNHPSGHSEACWDPERIVYEVAVGYDRDTGRAKLRWSARARDLHPCERISGAALASNCNQHFEG